MKVRWRKSSHSGSATDEICVEVAELVHGVGIRDSKDRDGARLAVSGVAFGDLLLRIKSGDLDQA